MTTEMQDAVDDDAMQLFVVVFVEKLGIGSNGIQRNDEVAIKDIILAIVEGDDVGIVVVTQIFVVDFEDVFVIAEQITHLANLLAIGGSYATNPCGGLAALDVGEFDVLCRIGDHLFCFWKEIMGNWGKLFVPLVGEVFVDVYAEVL